MHTSYALHVPSLRAWHLGILAADIKESYSHDVHSHHKEYGHNGVCCGMCHVSTPSTRCASPKNQSLVGWTDRDYLDMRVLRSQLESVVHYSTTIIPLAEMHSEGRTR